MAIKAEVLIYALVCPVSGRVRYVGKTLHMGRRLRQHVAETRRYPHLHKSKWIAGLLREGLRPEIRLLESVQGPDWQNREIHWIEQFEDLTNHSGGGNGCSSVSKSEDHVRRVSDALRGRSCVETQGERNNAARLSEDDVREIRRLKIAGILPGQIASQFGTTNQNVWLITTGRAWRHIEFEEVY